MARVKICGRSLADMQMAVQRGADAIGVLVGQLHSSSDFLTPKLAAEILANTPPFVTTVLVHCTSKIRMQVRNSNSSLGSAPDVQAIQQGCSLDLRTSPRCLQRWRKWCHDLLVRSP
jgi:hypothetical protein